MPSIDFRNFTYAVHPCKANVPTAAIVRAGSFDYFDPKMGQGFTIAVVSVVRGSLGVGTQQAAVILSCQFPIGGTASAYLYDIHDGTATLLGKIADASWGGDWGAGPNSIHISFANDALSVIQCGNTACDVMTTSTYVLRDGKLSTCPREQATPAQECRPDVPTSTPTGGHSAYVFPGFSIVRSRRQYRSAGQ